MSQELVTNVRNMQLIIEAIKVEGARIEDLIQAKAETARAYDVCLATTMARLKMEGSPTTTVEKLSKGDQQVSASLRDKIVAEESVKAHYSRLDNLKAQMNAYQSMNRHLSTGVM